MPDTIRSLLRCQRRFRSGAQPRTRRSKAQETALAIDDPEVTPAEARDVAASLVLGKADELAGQCLADEHVLALPLDRSRRTHTSHLVVGVVPRIVEARREGAVGRLPARRRWHLPERLVRSLLVVQRGLRTPTGPFVANFCTDIILGLAAGFVFMKRSTRPMASLSAAH